MFILVFAAFAWGGTARYVRSKSLSISEEEFIKANRISGASTYRVVRRHVVPNAASSIITQLTLLIPGFLLAEAQLAFLGLGDSTIPVGPAHLGRPERSLVRAVDRLGARYRAVLDHSGVQLPR